MHIPWLDKSTFQMLVLMGRGEDGNLARGQASRPPLPSPACTAPPRAIRGTATPQPPSREPTHCPYRKNGRKWPQAGTHPCHFTALCRGGPAEELKRPGTRSQPRERAWQTKHSPPRAITRQNLQAHHGAWEPPGGDTIQDASCSAEIREFPGSHCPASPWGQKSWQ